jgi:hypothetical protein
MILKDLYQRVQELVEQGHGDEEVYLDTDPHDLFTIGDIDLDTDGVGIIIWKA